MAEKLKHSHWVFFRCIIIKCVFVTGRDLTENYCFCTSRRSVEKPANRNWCFVRFFEMSLLTWEKSGRRSPERPSRGTAASRWDPGRTTTPPGSCSPSDCPGWGGAGAPEHDGVCWRSWTHSWDGGCGPSPAGCEVFKQEGSSRILQQVSQFVAHWFLFFFSQSTDLPVSVLW